MILTNSQQERIAALRAICDSCNGDAAVCQVGTPCEHEGICLADDCHGHLRLAGCRAWDDDGDLTELPRKAA